jgi:hypothetical protein
VFGLIMAVGPGDREVARMHDTLSMVAAHEAPEHAHLVLIDDDPMPRELDPRWPHQTVVRTPLRQRRNPDAYSAMTAGTLAGLTACRDQGVDLALKLDTDAAVIAPFSERLREVFADEQVGVVGSYDRTSSGDARDWTMWERPLARALRQWQITYGPGGRRVLWHKRRSDRRRARRLCAEAARHAPVGAHCLGGAYAVSGSFLNRAELDWAPWVGTDLSEDVVVGTLCAAVGLHMRSLVAPGEPFALAWQGLPASPREIRAAGHSIVHSVKADTLEEERRLRAELAGSAPEG